MGEILPHWRADIVHCNDWHTALIPALIVAHGKPRPTTILTIHNIAFQGIFPLDLLADLNLPKTSQTADSIEFYGQLSFLKSGLIHADRVTTVSPSYAEEIHGPEFGMGLDGVIAQRQEPLVGILNGIDHLVWDPARDPLLPVHYSRHDLAGKDQCKATLQREWGLDIDPSATLIVFLARLELQKMADILLAILPNLMERPGVQVAVLGTGSTEIEQAIAGWPSAAPGRVAVKIGYSEELAHRLLGAGDILLHGSRFEPCGLTPLYALRYGTVPIVNMVGGLRDTTIGVSAESLQDRSANAIHFLEPTGEAMLNAIDTALALRGNPETWHNIRVAAMSVDFSWSKAATAYRRLYRGLVLPEQPAHA